MEKKKKRRRHRGLRFLILVMGVLIACGVYQYREYGNIKDVMLKLIGQDPVIYQHVSEEIGEMAGKFYYQQLAWPRLPVDMSTPGVSFMLGWPCR